VNGIFGNSGSNILDGDAGADVMMGGAGNDAYFVDDAGDQTIENPGEGNDTVFSTAHFRLSANLDNLVLQGSADLQAFGNGAVNGIFGNSGSNILDGAAGADVMIGGAGNDAYFVDNSLDQAIENPGEGNDTVFTTIDLRLSANLDNLVLQGSSDLQGYGNSAANVIAGNSGSNILNGEAGVDGMFGGAGNDTYFVDNAGDVVVENAAEGNDTVFASVNYALAANVDNLVLQGGADLQGRGNSAVNAIFGNDGNNLLDGEGSADVLTGNSGNDTFIFSVGQGNGDTVVDFAGNGAGAGDSLLFVGYGPGATFTNIDATHWQVNFNGGASHDVITFSNGAAINASDFLFI
jgi:Ca2+-binding RTX toxin-like protein